MRFLNATAFVLLFGPFGLGQEVPWLGEVQLANGVAAPSAFNEPIPSLSTVGEAVAFQKASIDRWTEFLGAFDLKERREAPSIEVLESEEVESGLMRRRIRYETEQGQSVEAYVLGPIDTSVASPGVIVFHSTVPHSILQCVGLADPQKKTELSSDELSKAYALHLARKGFVTLSPRNFLWPKNFKMEAAEQGQAFLERNPRRLGMARMLYDAILGVDVLASLAGVDATRLGAVGHSLGAKEVLYLAAFDARIKASVSSEGGVGISQSNWDAAWYLGPKVKSPNFAMDHHQLVAAIAPRAFLLIGGDDADGVASIKTMSEADKVFRVFSTNPRLGLFNHGKGHAVPEESLAKTVQWLECYLRLHR